MAIVVTVNGACISLSGDIEGIGGHASVLTCRAALEKIIAASSGKSLQINLDQLDAVSSFVLSMFLCCMRQANDVSCELSFVNLSQGLSDMARVGGIESLFPRRSV